MNFMNINSNLRKQINLIFIQYFDKIYLSKNEKEVLTWRN